MLLLLFNLEDGEAWTHEQIETELIVPVQRGTKALPRNCTTYETSSEENGRFLSSSRNRSGRREGDSLLKKVILPSSILFIQTLFRFHFPSSLFDYEIQCAPLLPRFRRLAKFSRAALGLMLGQRGMQSRG